MDFRQLQYIIKVAQIGNITKAADELYITQPALSHFISKVEKEEGVKIFDRSTTPISLTYAGERYVETAQKILELNEQLKEEMEDIADNKKGRLIIGIPPARAANMLPKMIPTYLQRLPGVEIQTVEHNSRQLKEDVQKGIVDFAILPLIDNFDEFRMIELYEEELFLVAQKGKLGEDTYYTNDAGEKVIEIKKLKDEKFILLKSGHGVRGALDLLFKMNGFKPKIFMETTNNETAYGLASTGLGIAIVPQATIESLRYQDETDTFKVSDFGMKWTIVVILNKDSHISKLVKECIDLIKDVFA